MVSETIGFLDWFPTILAMTGVSKPDGLVLRGGNALALLAGKRPAEWDSDLFAQHDRLRAYRTPEWKLVRDFGPDGRDELYHLADAPAEHRNLIDSPAPAAQTARRELEANLQQVMHRIGDPQGYTP